MEGCVGVQWGGVGSCWGLFTGCLAALELWFESVMLITPVGPRDANKVARILRLNEVECGVQPWRSIRWRLWVESMCQDLVKN